MADVSPSPHNCRWRAFPSPLNGERAGVWGGANPSGLIQSMAKLHTHFISISVFALKNSNASRNRYFTVLAAIPNTSAVSLNDSPW